MDHKALGSGQFTVVYCVSFFLVYVESRESIGNLKIAVMDPLGTGSLVRVKREGTELPFCVEKPVDIATSGSSFSSLSVF
jgi:hypothetical protein